MRKLRKSLRSTVIGSSCRSAARRVGQRKNGLEAPGGIEPPIKGFADPSLPTWRRRPDSVRLSCGALSDVGKGNRELDHGGQFFIERVAIGEMAGDPVDQVDFLRVVRHIHNWLSSIKAGISVIVYYYSRHTRHSLALLCVAERIVF